MLDSTFLFLTCFLMSLNIMIMTNLIKHIPAVKNLFILETAILLVVMYYYLKAHHYIGLTILLSIVLFSQLIITMIHWHYLSSVPHNKKMK